jgi:tRNA nucleotidyltransferase (CCA-adding enzyme)
VLGIPNEVQSVLRTLEDRGYQAACVGGCVRDLLLGRQPDDWDVTTSALPEQTLALFGADAAPTGLAHGTVTVRSGSRRVEVTTFRRDGAYRDRRHPDTVRFTASLEEDLARRDFTVNAMALDLRGELHDPWGGRQDLEAGVLRCVGAPEQRLGEDALRIMRCLRFAAVLGFSVEPETERCLRRDRKLLSCVAPERLREELTRLLCGQHAAEVLRRYPEVLGVFLPEILPAVGFDQNNYHHCYDVWEHTLHSLEQVPPEPVLRYTMLFHDLGKPETYTEDAGGVGHFYGHEKASRALAAAIMDRLRFDKTTRTRILVLVKYHDVPILCAEKSIRRALNRLGEEGVRALLAVKRADNLAQHPDFWGRQKEIDALEALLEQVLASESCFSLKQLAVNGSDLLSLGFSGPELGQMLQRLLEQVLDGRLPNERQALLAYARSTPASARGKRP